MSTRVFDVECYSNFFMVLFKDVETCKVQRFQISPSRSLDVAGLQRTMESNLVVGFNSRNYDVPMIQLALSGASAYELYLASQRLIVEGMRYRDFCEAYDLSEKPGFDHVDLIEVAPLKGSLKIYGGRLHCQKLQDLPVDPHAEITAELAKQLYTYCVNDLDLTIALWRELAGQIQLRVQMSAEYGQDLRSRSDAQIAEHVIVSEVAKIVGFWPKKPQGVTKKVKYDVPDNVNFTSRRLSLLLDEIRATEFAISDGGSVVLPDCLNSTIRIGNGAYRLGIGGIHSSEASTYHLADTETYLIDRDVASYYPSIILNQGLSPGHLGPAFLTVYRTLVERRLAAKKAGNKQVADSLKIVINGGFGKFGSKFSNQYSPRLLIQVTISGQLYLLMLIEMLESSGLEVISANTDGIVTKVSASRYNDFLSTVQMWETITGFVTEETRYSGLYSRDVNNFIAFKEDGTVKSKGVYVI